ALALQDVARAGEAERGELRREQSARRGAAGVEVLGHRAVRQELPEAARLGAGVAQRPGVLLGVQPEQPAGGGGGAEDAAGGGVVPVVVMALAHRLADPDR